MIAPPIPQFLAHLPTRNGLVVPYISLELGGRVHFGQTRGIRVAECFVSDLCQICGRSIEHRPYLFLATQAMIDDGFSSEPPLHPVCAAYSVKACPMVGGRLAAYAKHQANLDGAPCPDPDCSCAGIVSNGGPGQPGEPAKPWFQAWYRNYAVGVRDASKPLTVGNITGAVLAGLIKARPITSIKEKKPWPTSPDE